MNKKIIHESEISDYRSSINDKRVVLVGGCFDLLHYGHFSFLQAAKKEGDILIIALESDDFISQKKKRPPVHSQDQRAEILAGLEFVDVVVKLPFMNANDDYKRLVEEVVPSIIAVTEGDPHIEYKKMHASRINAEVKTVIPTVPSFSTSSIIAYANLLRD